MPAIPVGGWLGVLLTALASFVLTDFLIYWCHRAQHRLLWRSHAVHHSISEMSAANFYVHWTEHLFRIPLVTIPVALLSPSGDSLAIASALVVAQNAYAHSAAKFDLGPLRWLIVGNRWHRIHHSLEPTHFDRNFGNALIVWDVLFGTASFPKAEEWPAVGLDDQAEPDGIVDYLTRPFRPSARPQTAEH